MENNRVVVQVELDKETYDRLKVFAEDNGATAERFIAWYMEKVVWRNGRIGADNEREYWEKLRSQLSGITLKTLDLKRTEQFRVLTTDGFRRIEMYIDSIGADPIMLATVINGLFDREDPHIYIGQELAGIEIIDIEDIYPDDEDDIFYDDEEDMD